MIEVFIGNLLNSRGELSHDCGDERDGFSRTDRCGIRVTHSQK